MTQLEEDNGPKWCSCWMRVQAEKAIMLAASVNMP
jgi:hypothetical protein